jgi:hypothetical protein
VARCVFANGHRARPLNSVVRRQAERMATIAENWQQAAADLGFKFVAPFFLQSSNGHFQYFGHLPEFGSPKGLVIIVGHEEALCQAAREEGLIYSCLIDGVGSYDRETFIATLNDWGWHGPAGAEPNWYTGAQWG